jgi:hypothetical protein
MKNLYSNLMNSKMGKMDKLTPGDHPDMMPDFRSIMTKIKAKSGRRQGKQKVQDIRKLSKQLNRS